jgi:predicted SAM-dependent methyltransferase
MQHMDVTALPIDDNRYSLLWCSHVLEHVEDDVKAMSEMFRVLRPMGLAVVMVPVYGDATYEDLSIKSPSERLRYFKQADHVRLYGKDVEGRLASVGFRVKVISTSELPCTMVERWGIDYPSTREIFLCTKPLVS